MDADYVSGERRPIEILVFEMEPDVVDEFLVVDHEVWTLGEAATPGCEQIPFLSKEVWLDDAEPGRVTIVFVWDRLEDWEQVDQPSFQAELQATFDARFPHPLRLVSGPERGAPRTLHRYSRFERR
jgi:uncharacterized protein (TIGR03792 family)